MKNLQAMIDKDSNEPLEELFEIIGENRDYYTTKEYTGDPYYDGRIVEVAKSQYYPTSAGGFILENSKEPIKIIKKIKIISNKRDNFVGSIVDVIAENEELFQLKVMMGKEPWCAMISKKNSEIELVEDYTFDHDDYLSNYQDEINLDIEI